MEGALVAVVVAAVVFAFTNGFNDASASIATSVATRALTPGIAITMAAGFNLLGALLGGEVARFVQVSIIDPGPGGSALVVVGSALVAAASWNGLMWWRGLPSSSSHALISALAGSALAMAFGPGPGTASVHWVSILLSVVAPMLIVPALGFVAAYLLTTGIMWGWRDASPSRAFRRFEHAQTVSAAALALGHGLQDAQKTMGAVVIALVAVGWQTGSDVPMWLRCLVAVAMAAGTLAGGWRIVRTLGRRLVDLDPPKGFAAETVAASLLYLSSAGLGVPVSTTHVLTGAVVGTGLTRRTSAVRWRVAGDIAGAWLLTPPMAALIAAGCCLLANLVLL